ncbi:restriction endonuclease subunit S [Mesorhizobium sp. B1-1-6]|uniref:restriction endonuclease subunit S n=1 Tax=Mesorhizobium sp. B1-1-6 TaxID=2589978 RepID=UPI00112A24E7|nr:restriction endonuclease subunit S [Mesorhizobium sp. B1-1-6]TPN41377.1 restriction endonuclease subunit S [Mesorhizobium sp. B1-1-6]
MSYPQKLIGDFCREGIVELQTGPFGSQLHSYDYVEDGVAVVPTEAIKDRRIVPDALPRVARATADRLSKHKLVLGDILFARRGAQATGQTAIVREEDAGAICGTGAIRLRVRGKQSSLLPAFLSHFLSSPEAVAWIRAQAIGATMPNLNEGIIKRIAVPTPPFELQTQMATMLDDLDDKIELNRRINETLEAMAQAIFCDWFVDFGPTRRKIEGATDPIVIMGGLVVDPNVARQLADLFPTLMDENGLPKGWRLAQISSVTAMLKRGLAPKYADEGIPVVNQRCIRDRSVDLSFARQHGADRPVPKDRLLQLGDVLVNSTGVGTLGRVATVRQLPGPATADSHVTICRVDGTKISPALVSLFLEASEDVIAGMGQGSTGQTELSPASLGALALAVPSPEVQRSFENFIMPMRELSSSNSDQNRILVATRDLLLPKLMSGEIRLREAERRLEAAQ